MTSQESLVVFHQPEVALLYNLLHLFRFAATVDVNMVTKRLLCHIEQPVPVMLFLLILWLLSVAWFTLVALEAITMRLLLVSRLLFLVTWSFLFMTPRYFPTSVHENQRLFVLK